jgi:hypothetical protein
MGFLIWGDTARPGGIRVPPEPPPDVDPYGLAIHYFGFYEKDYARTRNVVKNHLRTYVIGSAAGNGVIALTGAAIAVWKKPWLGLVSSALAGIVGVLAAWEGLGQHREMWRQRTVVLSELQEAKRSAELALATGNDRREVGTVAMEQLNSILSKDRETWAEVVHRPPQRPLTDRPS